ncbi:E3 ubiquitin-protein ligase Kcmf1 isoform X1 [Teleopsis dalmanni]|uniref:E3 ubiquitin-protein ligase Kcmf1 isoform X1 n=1 Tax=Teleopsis dalmanni TaxID=139649 RepID=UPI0018CDF178|nr:E3 ubiquitin-protein ligase Kcmf1 isoform X1 [Teleopsis dalmanni]
MSRHEGVSCDSCLKSNFNGRRYKCLICYDYDLCADCYEEGVTSTHHLVDHPMQCILTRTDIDLFFGGEMLNSDQPQSYTCPYCKKMGYSDATLLEHVTAEHTETSLEVVCPVCAGMPGGEPNLVTDDFAGHLTLEHRTGPRELISFIDEPSAIRHGGGVRRIPGRTLVGQRARRSNMHFSSSSGLSALSPSGRESVDPIAELLSQLSGVRRGGPQSSQLQQIQMQIQLERQQVAIATRQQLERLPRRAHPLVSASNSNATMAEVISGGNVSSAIMTGNSTGSNSVNGGSSCRANEWSISTSGTNQQPQSQLTANAVNAREVQMLQYKDIAAGTVNSNATGGSIVNGAEGQSQFLLTKFMQPNLSDSECAEADQNRADRSQFVQALLLSALSRVNLDIDLDHEKRGESQETNSDSVNNERGTTNIGESLIETHDKSKSDGGIHISGTGVNSRQQVHQQQQTSPEDFSEEYKQQQQPQPQQQTYLLKKKASATSGGTGTGKPISDRGIERRGRPPPPPVVGTGAIATGSEPNQQQGQSQQKYKQPTTPMPANQIPDTR